MLLCPPKLCGTRIFHFVAPACPIGLQQRGSHIEGGRAPMGHGVGVGRSKGKAAAGMMDAVFGIFEIEKHFGDCFGT